MGFEILGVKKGFKKRSAKRERERESNPRPVRVCFVGSHSLWRGIVLCCRLCYEFALALLFERPLRVRLHCLWRGDTLCYHL